MAASHFEQFLNEATVPGFNTACPLIRTLRSVPGCTVAVSKLMTHGCNDRSWRQRTIFCPAVLPWHSHVQEPETPCSPRPEAEASAAVPRPPRHGFLSVHQLHRAPSPVSANRLKISCTSTCIRCWVSDRRLAGAAEFTGVLNADAEFQEVLLFSGQYIRCGQLMQATASGVLGLGGRAADQTSPGTRSEPPAPTSSLVEEKS